VDLGIGQHLFGLRLLMCDGRLPTDLRHMQRGMRQMSIFAEGLGLASASGRMVMY
jgi:hypothetical protein